MVFKFLGAIATGSLTASLPYFANNILGGEGLSTIGLAIYILTSAALYPALEPPRPPPRQAPSPSAGGPVRRRPAAIGLLVSSQGGSVLCRLRRHGDAISAYMLIPFSFPGPGRIL